MWRDHGSSTRPRYSGNSGARHKQERKKPDHFIAFQITNPKILKEMEETQTSIVAKRHYLIDSMTPVHTSHITLMVMSLPNYHRKQSAKDALDLCASRLQSEYRNKPIVLDIAGIGRFGDRVVFANIHAADTMAGDILQHVHGVVMDSFEEYGIYTTESRPDFNPHVTLAKTSLNGEGGIDPALYQDRIDHFFGREVVTSIQLCAMGMSDGGYYDVLHQVQFGRDVLSKSSSGRQCSAAGVGDGAMRDTVDLESAVKGMERLRCQSKHRPID